jgi:hypothetical protein
MSQKGIFHPGLFARLLRGSCKEIFLPYPQGIPSHDERALTIAYGWIYKQERYALLVSHAFMSPEDHLFPNQ